MGIPDFLLVPENLRGQFGILECAAHMHALSDCQDVSESSSLQTRCVGMRMCVRMCVGVRTGWMNLFLTMARLDLPDDQQPANKEDRPSSPWWKSRKWLFHIFYRYAQDTHTHTHTSLGRWVGSCTSDCLRTDGSDTRVPTFRLIACVCVLRGRM